MKAVCVVFGVSVIRGLLDGKLHHVHHHDHNAGRHTDRAIPAGAGSMRTALEVARLAIEAAIGYDKLLANSIKVELGKSGILVLCLKADLGFLITLGSIERGHHIKEAQDATDHLIKMIKERA